MAEHDFDRTDGGFETRGARKKIVEDGKGIPTTVYATEPLGGETIIDLELGHQVIKSIAPPTIALQTDAKVAIRFDAQRIHVFDAAGRSVMSAAGADGAFKVSFA